MSEAKWNWDWSAGWIQLIEPSGGIFFEFQVDEDVQYISETKVQKLVNALNMHDRLVTACKDFASIKGKIPEFPGSAFLEIARDLARAALAETAEVPT